MKKDDDDPPEDGSDQPDVDAPSGVSGVRIRKRSVRQRGLRRKKSVSVKKISRRELAEEWERLGEDARNYDRPKTRGECLGMSRPCPFAGCRHHNYLDINAKTGSITINWPDHTPDTMPAPTCSLDVAQSGGKTHEQVGEVLNLTRERVRQIEIRAIIAKVRPAATAAELNEVQIGEDTQTAMEEVENSSPECMPSDVSFLNH